MHAAYRMNQKSGDAKVAGLSRSPLLRLPTRSDFSGNQKTESFWRLRRQTALRSNQLSKIEDEDQDLRQNASQASINRQFYPLIEEENLSELPEPPLVPLERAMARFSWSAVMLM